MKNFITLMVETYRGHVITLLLSAVALLALIVGYQLWSERSGDDAVQTSVIVEPGNGGADLPSPFLYFSALGNNLAGELQLHTYAYNFLTDSVEPVSLFDGDHSFSYVDERHALYVGRSWEVDDETHPDYWTILWSDYVDEAHGLISTISGWNERDLTAHPGGEYIAYAHQPQQVDDEASRSLDTWEVVVINPVAGSVRQIPGASTPQWVGDGLGLVYLKSDGVYYTTADGTEEVHLYNGYTGLTRNADLAVSSDGSYLAVTVPGLGSMEVLQVVALVPDGVSSKYVLTTSNGVVRHPVFDRNTYHFATVRFDNVAGPVIEVRSIVDPTLLAEVSLGQFVQPFFALNDWTNVLVTAAPFAERMHDTGNIHTHD